MKELTSGYRY